MAVLKLLSDFLNITRELLEPNDFSSLTWMATGAAISLMAQYCLPFNLGGLLPVLYLGFRIVKTIIDVFQLHITCFTNIKHGRWSATLNDSGIDNSSHGIAIFVLGARLNQYRQTPYLKLLERLTVGSPLQKLARGASEVNDLFQERPRQVGL